MMKGNRWNRVLSGLLSLLMVLSLIPATALAESGGTFCLVAEAGGRLVIAPEHISYTAGQTVGEALAASGHRFEGLEQGNVTEIDGVVGNYRRGDQDGGYDLSAPAAGVRYYRFSENVNNTPSEALTGLMQAMADYLLEPADVRAAAVEAYGAAASGFVEAGYSDEKAAELTAVLNGALDEYRNHLNGEKFPVTFAAGGNGTTVTASNRYGRVWTDENASGVLYLPAGEYTFRVSREGRHVTGSITVSGSMRVDAALPEGEWLKTESLVFSGSNGDNFDAGAFPLFWEGRTAVVRVPDAFAGTVYVFAEHTLEKTPSLTAYYTDAAGKEREKKLAFGSRQSGTDGALTAGAGGNSVLVRVGVTLDNGYEQQQDYQVELHRIPSLGSISLLDGKEGAQAPTESFEPDKTAYTYRVLSTIKELTVKAAPFDNSYTVTVNGEPMTEAGVIVSVEGTTAIRIEVTGGNYSTAYELTVIPVQGKKITFVTKATDVEVTVVNGNGDELPCYRYKGTDSFNRYDYMLVPGETYYYVASAGGYFHAKDSFTLEEDADSIVEVDVCTESWLTDLAFGPARTSSNKGKLPMEEDFAAGVHEYTLTVRDTDSAVFIWANAPEGVTVEAVYGQIHSSVKYDGKELVIPVDTGSKNGTQLQRVLLPKSAWGNRVVIRLSRQNGGITDYQDYVVNIRKKLSLSGLTASCNGISVPLVREDGGTGYQGDVTEYTVSVPAAATEFRLTPAVFVREESGGVWNVRYGTDSTGYCAAVNGEAVAGGEEVPVSLTGDQTTERVTVTVTNTYAPAEKTEYVITVQKAAPVYTTFVTDPAEVLPALYEKISGQRIWPEENAWLLSEGYSYDYMLTCSGFVGQRGVIEVTRNDEGDLILRMGDREIPVTPGDDGISVRAVVDVTLTSAPENPDIDPDIPSSWSDFRGNEDNSGVTDAKIPFEGERGTLYWANQIGSGMDSNAAGCPILVDGALITYAADKLYRMDAVTGEILAVGTMDHTSSFSITPPTYYEGMIFMALSDGTVQAFNAETLESLWIYRDDLKGQPNSPMTVKDGYLYTGFWVGESARANFVCIPVTDEDPSRGDEEKVAAWYHTRIGGFYWAGAYVGDDYLLVGTDDGYGGYLHQTSSLLLMDRRTGRVLDSWDGLSGDIRCTVSRDAENGSFCFTSKGGRFYSVKVEKNDADEWTLADKWWVALDNGMDDPENPPMSTSTPVVYKGRAYIGVAGIGQFSLWSGHSLTVIDLSSRAIAYRVETPAYSQTSGLLTTAYEEETGYVYIYFFENAGDGQLRVLRDKAGQTEADYLTMEKGKETPYVVFTPVGDQAQYAICSPIVDDYGTIYFKNDSGNLMAFGSRIEKLEVTRLPDKTEYRVGDIFDPAGMRVTATYANGMTRDVTAYVTFPKEVLEKGTDTVTLTFPHVMYHNQDEADGSTTAGIASTKPTVEISVTVKDALPPATGLDEVEVLGDEVKLTFNGAPDEGWLIVLAAHDENGRMIGAVTCLPSGQQTETVDFPGAEDAHEVKAYVVDGNYCPVF